MRFENLASLDCDFQMILLRGEGAGGKLRESAWRTVGLVEIHKNSAIFVRVGVMIAPGGIGGTAIGQIHELDEEATVR